MPDTALLALSLVPVALVVALLALRWWHRRR